ncbi:peptidoglycan DD-metalloendopeptidase family protein [Planococcus sp. CPCC 101016]|uniref:murein hydrolase activator EnvC family protein n=1 Tax=Planococcus sp. CPCC 101016 TaxID=2599617 RepID=UPI0011B49578|nr:peptidoglycan DD-metalloendopeptidase family protein [Planococcus sp. CPCC 101016]TWT08073.1 peptidoglycan DD-metalloendopeptidase family protein [Planococcus sp. CPCC 101016]
MSLKLKWMVTGVSSVLAFTMYLPATNANTISELEKKQQETEQKKSELDSGIQEKSNAISKNQTKLTGIMAKITELDNQITETARQVAGVQEEIDQTKIEIDELKKSIEELEEKIAERTELLKERARAIQMSGGSVDYIDVLLGASSFIDFIDRFSAVNTLIEADRDIMLQQAQDKELLAKQKAEVETKLAEQRDRQAALQVLKNSLDAQKSEQDGLVKELTAEQNRLAHAKSELEDRFEEEIEISVGLEQQIVAEQARLAELARIAEEERKRTLAAEEERQRLAAVEAEKQRQATSEKNAEENRLAADRKAASTLKKSENASASSTPSPAQKPESNYTAPAASTSSPFIRPAAGRHTSGFGGRDIGDGAETHLGYDIANVTSTPILAAAAGYVSYAGIMGGYGNVVILTHSINGQTHATVYAHLNSIGVSVGQSVSQGQQVGGMGNTGRSTGTHLHFEVHVGPWNGARSNAVNPAPYIR